MTPPPTNIDGTDITGATIDCQDVQEITVDGQTVFSPGPVLRVVRYNFENNGDTSSITDSFGNNDGTINGAAYTTDSEVGNFALSFDGTGDNVDVPDFPAGLGAFSFGGYYKEFRGDARPRMISCSSNNFRAYINFKNNTGWEFGVNGNLIKEGTTSYTTGNYRFVVFVYDKTGLGDGTTAKIYSEDANEIASGTPSTSDILTGGKLLGSRGPGDHWDGHLDDLRGYSKGLSSTEVSNWYNTGTID